MDNKKITLKAARVNSGLTQKEAAKRLNISVKTLHNYEHRNSFPNVAVIKKIEDLYELDYNNIIFLPNNYG